MKIDLYYICSPLSAPTEEERVNNMHTAKNYAERLQGVFGFRTIAPHSFLPLYLDDTIKEEREIALSFGLSVLSVCTGLIVCGNRISEGMKGEIRKAKELGLPIFKCESITGRMINLIEEEGEFDEV